MGLRRHDRVDVEAISTGSRFLDTLLVSLRALAVGVSEWQPPATVAASVFMTSPHPSGKNHNFVKVPPSSRPANTAIADNAYPHGESPSGKTRDLALNLDNPFPTVAVRFVGIAQDRGVRYAVDSLAVRAVNAKGVPE